MGLFTIVLTAYTLYTNEFEDYKTIIGILALVTGALYATQQKSGMISPEKAKELALNDLESDQRLGKAPAGEWVVWHKAPKIDEKYHAYVIGCYIREGSKWIPKILKVVDAWTGIISDSFPIMPSFRMEDIEDRYTMKDFGSKIMKLAAVEDYE